MDNHYVPQFLLSSWAERLADGKVEAFRLDLPRPTSRRFKPRSTGFEPDLYALTRPTVAGMDQHAVETKFLAQIDSDSAVVLAKLTRTNIATLEMHERLSWARFVSSLRIRQPKMVKRLRTEASEVLRANFASETGKLEELGPPGDEHTLESWAEARFPGIVENFGLSFFHKIVDDPRIVGPLLSCSWSVMHFDEVEDELLLSDHPCIFVGGLGDPNLFIVLPISPRRAFLMARQHETIDRILSNPPDVIVRRTNASSANQATTRVYATNQSMKSFVAERHALRGNAA